jgi:retron-type reverse transcriptase
MKTWKNLYPSICSFENLLLAARKAQRGRRFWPEVYAFNSRLEENLVRMQRELESQTWEPGPYRDFYVQEAKRRLISAAPYADRVVHHALCNVVEPLFDRAFIFDSYACRKGKGTHAAADRYTEFSHRAGYVLKCDISRYFASIRHDVLFAQLARRIGDGKTLYLLEQIIRSRGDDGLLWPCGAGIPIGNQTSQFFANVYLNGFDHWMKEEAPARFYIRYVDDFVVLHGDKKWLGALVPRIEDKLTGLGLELHPKKRTVFPVSEGCDFMGYRIWPERRRVRPSNGYRFQRRLKAMAWDYRAGEIELEEVKASVMSWIGHAQHADTRGLRKAVFRGVSFSRG